MTMLNLYEIKAGLVAHLDPDRLREYGGDACSVNGKHDFLILKVDGDRALVLPLTSKWKPYREQIPQEDKHGHERWTGRDTYVLGEPFLASTYAVQVASKCEYSENNNRNTVDMKWCADFIRRHGLA